MSQNAISKPRRGGRRKLPWAFTEHGICHTTKDLGVDASVMWGEFFFVEALTKVVMGA